MKVIGITGCTGAGKSVFLDLMRSYGAVVLDCDAIYHKLLCSSAPMLAELNEAFPSAVSNDQVNRKRLSEIVFNDSAALEKLNEITHRYVLIEVERRIAAARANNCQILCVEAIALIESGLSRNCDDVISIVADEEIRAQRIMARDCIDFDAALLRIRAQKPASFYQNSADFVLKNNFSTISEFQSYCVDFLKSYLSEANIMTSRDDLYYKQKHLYAQMDDAEKQKSEAYCEAYKSFLNASKTEREAVSYAISLAENKGFKPFTRGYTAKPGDKLYRSVRGKALILAVIGSDPLSEGINLEVAHVDAPRLDLKQNPLYESDQIAYFKTHYYGGIRKYQWVTIPLALHGVVVRSDGTVVNVVIGEDESDPIFMITDLLPHLAADQNKKSLGEAITGEGLNILLGSYPADEQSDAVKLTVLRALNEKYGICEEDFLSAELCAVPAGKARDVGLDRSLISSYGHDDRVCAFAELSAIFEVESPEKTAVCVLIDKEEIGSEGVSGMQSEAFESFIFDLCQPSGTPLTHCFERSFCLSADVTNAFDPLYPEVSEKQNNAKINYGMGIMKFTGHGGKSGSNDASAEVVGKVRAIFKDAGVIWQMGELGKVDQGGGGTIAKYTASRNIDTIDAGVPVLSMHAPMELVAKFDCYMTYRGMLAFYSSK